MNRRITIASILLVLALAATQILWAAQPGKTGTVFNRRFIARVKPGMPYGQIVKMTGTPGLQVADKKAASAGFVRYQWSGGKDSVFHAGFAAGKMVDATILAPNGHTYSIRKNGDVVDMGY
jgi:hypothetical protein